MARGIEKTWSLLTRTHNGAATFILVEALKSSEVGYRARAIRALAKRPEVSGHLHILRHFPSLSKEEKEILVETLREHPQRFKEALHQSVVSNDGELCGNACHVILMNRDFDLFPALVEAFESADIHNKDQVSATLVRLANMLQQEIVGKNGEHKKRDPYFVRRQALTSLEVSLQHYAKHERKEVLEAYLLLVPHDNAKLQQILQVPRHELYEPIIDSIQASILPGIMDLLLDFFRDRSAPSNVLQVIAQRTDPKFLAYLLDQVGPDVSLRVLENMSQLSEIAWLQEERDVLLDLEGPAQAAAVHLAMAAQIDPSEKIGLLTFMLRRGKPEGRLACCEALAEFQTPQAKDLILEALIDSDLKVQAAATRQLRSHGLNDALERLVALLDDSSEEVRDASRSSLSEFSFTRYDTSFDLLDEDMRKSMGPIVKKVDTSSIGRLEEMLQSPSPTLKLRGIEMAVAMEAAQDVYESMIHLLDYNDAALRTEMVLALGECEGPEVQAALEKAIEDPHPSVQKAAQQSLDQQITDPHFL